MLKLVAGFIEEGRLMPIALGAIQFIVVQKMVIGGYRVAFSSYATTNQEAFLRFGGKTILDDPTQEEPMPLADGVQASLWLHFGELQNVEALLSFTSLLTGRGIEEVKGITDEIPGTQIFRLVK